MKAVIHIWLFIVNCRSYLEILTLQFLVIKVKMRSNYNEVHEINPII